LASLLVGCAAAATAQEQAYKIDPEHTYPTYAVEHFGVSLQRGRFDSTQGRIILNPTAKTGSVEIVVEARPRAARR
jgi:polyisoprenoid-binding protein YceI